MSVHGRNSLSLWEPFSSRSYTSGQDEGSGSFCDFPEFVCLLALLREYDVPYHVRVAIDKRIHCVSHPQCVHVRQSHVCLCVLCFFSWNHWITLSLPANQGSILKLFHSVLVSVCWAECRQTGLCVMAHACPVCVVLHLVVPVPANNFLAGCLLLRVCGTVSVATAVQGLRCSCMMIQIDRSVTNRNSSMVFFFSLWLQVKVLQYSLSKIDFLYGQAAVGDGRKSCNWSMLQVYIVWIWGVFSFGLLNNPLRMHVSSLDTWSYWCGHFKRWLMHANMM